MLNRFDTILERNKQMDVTDGRTELLYEYRMSALL